jgi:type II secretory pathway component PulF
MATFAYLAYNNVGQHVDGHIDAANLGQAADLLHKRGLLAYRTTLVAARATVKSLHR